MKISGRAVLAAGITALTVGALTITPSVLPASMRTIQVLPPVAFTADSTVLPVSDDEVRAALDLIGEVSSTPGDGTITIRLGTDEVSDTLSGALPTAGAAREVDRSPVGGRAAATADELAALEQSSDEPAALNAASDIINDVYAVTRYWANYVSLELGPWLINWVPFGYLISDQIYIWYPDFVLPVVDSFVYDFLDPVVNNPLDLQVWITGIGDIINTAVTGVYNGIVSEIQYVLDFGWFPIPLPPLPDLPLPRVADPAEAAVTLAATETEPAAETTEDDQATGTPGTTEAADATADTGADVQTPAGEVTDAGAPAEGDTEPTGAAIGEPVTEVEEPVEDTEVPVGEEPADEAEETLADVDESAGGAGDETLDEIIEENLEDVAVPGDDAAEEAEKGESGEGVEVTVEDGETGDDAESAPADTASDPGE